ncbi:MAG TPA: hypothetical protein DEA22_07365 [Blastocatellia bacterium]|nr:hypothetical protein [Blastocatellia bacterium]
MRPTKFIPLCLKAFTLSLLIVFSAATLAAQETCVKDDFNCYLRNANADIAKDPTYGFYVYVRAGIYARMKNYAAALADYDLALSMSWGGWGMEHGRWMVYRARAEMNSARGEYDAAIRDYSSLIAMGGGSGDYWGRGNAYLNKGEPQSALNDYNTTERLMREKGETIGYGLYFQRGRANLGLKKWDQTISDFTLSIGLNAKESASYYNRALAFINKEDQNSALADLSQAIIVDVNNASAYFERGRIYLDRKSYESAIADYSKYIALNSSEPAGYANRALAFEGKGDIDAAIADHSSALKIMPGYKFSLGQRAWLHRKKKDFALAIADYDTLEKLDPSSETPFTSRINVYLDAGDKSSVEREYVRFLAFNPLHGHHLRGHFYFNEKRYSDAAADFTECYKLDKVFGDCLLDRAQTYSSAKNYDLALADIEASINMKQSVNRANMIKADVYLDQKRYADSLAICDDLIKNNVAGFSPRTRRANVFREQGEFAKAQAEYETAIASGEQYGYTYYNRALLLIKMNKRPEAIADLEKALEISPNYDEAKRDLEKLKSSTPVTSNTPMKPNQR